jgi:glycosyltransferase involved in cell wall biosynthesis
MRLVLVGDGTLRSEVQDILEQGRARDLAWLAGERADVPAVLRGLDCFVLPSRAEGVSNTVLEAMASGLPVVATRAGANAELMENGSTGCLVSAEDSAALALGILGYFRDPALGMRHGRAGRQRVERRFSLERMVEQYDRLYGELIVGSRLDASRVGPASSGPHVNG